MAQTIDSFEFSGRNAKHDWDSWLDGQIWELEAGTDFTSKPSSLRASAVKQAGNKGKSLKFQVRDNGNVVLQAV
jgi:hypothetical protein